MILSFIIPCILLFVPPLCLYSFICSIFAVSNPSTSSLTTYPHTSRSSFHFARYLFYFFLCEYFSMPLLSPLPLCPLLLLPLFSYFSPFSPFVLTSFLHCCPHSYPVFPLFLLLQPWQPAVVSCPSPLSRGQQVTCCWVGRGVQPSPLPSVRHCSSTALLSSPW